MHPLQFRGILKRVHGSLLPSQGNGGRVDCLLTGNPAPLPPWAAALSRVRAVPGLCTAGGEAVTNARPLVPPSKPTRGGTTLPSGNPAPLQPPRGGAVPCQVVVGAPGASPFGQHATAPLDQPVKKSIGSILRSHGRRRRSSRSFGSQVILPLLPPVRTIVPMRDHGEWMTSQHSLGEQLGLQCRKLIFR